MQRSGMQIRFRGDASKRRGQALNLGGLTFDASEQHTQNKRNRGGRGGELQKKKRNNISITQWLSSFRFHKSDCKHGNDFKIPCLGLQI